MVTLANLATCTVNALRRYGLHHCSEFQALDQMFRLGAGTVLAKKKTVPMTDLMRG